MFEAILQDELDCKDGFQEAKSILEEIGESGIKERLDDLHLAINVLKHGRGRSYDQLVKKSNDLPFRVKQPQEALFDEGDISSIESLIQVDDAFVMSCSQIIQDVSAAIRTLRPDYNG